MYIDDCSVFGDTNIEFVSRLRLVFERFRKHDLYLKANKCYFGFKELEFVGKVSSEKELKKYPVQRSNPYSISLYPLWANS